MINDIQTISRKIGIIGTARSGKTVLLTSLINHLIEHNRTDFVIGSGKPTQISSFKLRTASQARKNNFNYAAYRDALVYKGEWPEKPRIFLTLSATLNARIGAFSATNCNFSMSPESVLPILA